MWLFHDTGWRRYEIAEFHALSLAQAHADAETITVLQAELKDRTNEYIEACHDMAVKYEADLLHWRQRAEAAEASLKDQTKKP